MRQWEDRSPAVADMLNPALLAAVIAAAASEYSRLSDEPMPYGYAFLVAPLVLHHDTRAALPTSANSHLARWLANHEVIAAGFGERARALSHPVREGIRLGLRTGTLRIENGALYGTLASRTRPARIGDIANVILKSGFVGRWLTKLDRPATAFALFGVTP